MKTTKEEKPIVGTLHTPFGDFEMLELKPARHNIPWFAKDTILSFYVMDGYGVAKYIMVSGNFMVVPASEIKVKSVTFILDEEKVEHPELASV